MNDKSSNAYEFSVSELAFSLKRTVEDTYGRVRVRGELGRVTIAKSGHMYADLKDDKAVIASVMWKGNVSRLPIAPEEGMEVIASGKLSTYPGRSQYQLIMEHLEPTGIGALMALLERRKKQMQAEGLFDRAHKKPLPFLPDVIGVVTSPTGAVIRDILHRLEDRFGVHVLVWPVLVQGDKAAAQITNAINGFNAIAAGGEVPRPDVLIVARGGGSIEDLWCFNEENVVRAAFASDIPLISAVGHETDWTLIDYVADERAPTPTGAAEIAVPVRADLIATVEDYGARLKRALLGLVERKGLALKSARLPKLENILATPRQRFDLIAARLVPALEAGRKEHASRLMAIAGRLRPQALLKDIERKSDLLVATSRQAGRAMQNMLKSKTERLERVAQLLEAYSYQGVLGRGYALVKDERGHVVRAGKNLQSGQRVELVFHDTNKQAVIDGEDNPPIRIKPASLKPARPKKARKTKKPDDNQGQLF